MLLTSSILHPVHDLTFVPFAPIPFSFSKRIWLVPAHATLLAYCCAQQRKAVTSRSIPFGIKEKKRRLHSCPLDLDIMPSSLFLASRSHPSSCPRPQEIVTLDSLQRYEKYCSLCSCSPRCPLLFLPLFCRLHEGPHELVSYVPLLCVFAPQPVQSYSADGNRTCPSAWWVCPRLRPGTGSHEACPIPPCWPSPARCTSYGSCGWSRSRLRLRIG